MHRRLISGFAFICVAAACGETKLISSSQSKDPAKNTEAEQSSDAQSIQVKTLRSKSTASSILVKSENTHSFTLSQPLELAQFGTQTVDVTVQGSTPSGSVELQPPTVAGYKVEYLTSAGAALSGPLTLDSEAKANFKLRLTSELTAVDDVVKAPGAGTGQIVLRATDAGQSLSSSVSFKTSNVALVPMNVTAVKDLPKRFEFPAGTVPVFVNPADRAVVEVMHFAEGGAGAAQFKHQAPNGKMLAGRGYCPLNDGTTSVQVDPNQPLPAECLPCPADATEETAGIFYDHDKVKDSLKERRDIVCLPK